MDCLEYLNPMERVFVKIKIYASLFGSKIRFVNKGFKLFYKNEKILEYLMPDLDNIINSDVKPSKKLTELAEEAKKEFHDNLKCKKIIKEYYETLHPYLMIFNKNKANLLYSIKPQNIFKPLHIPPKNVARTIKKQFIEKRSINRYLGSRYSKTAC